MSADYQRAVDALYQAPLATFVVERKRLAGELKTAGDKASAATFAKLARPTQSAWAVNQLWWHARHDLEALFATAARLKQGEMAAGSAHREAIAKLRARAAALLVEGGHAAPEGTLRRITTTLAALAATGGFEPDTPGTLAADRDPPGFEAAGIPMPAAEPDRDDEGAAGPGDELAARRAAKAAPKPVPAPDPKAAVAAAKREAEAAAERERAEAAAERRKREAARAKRAIDRHRIETAIKTARSDVERREKEVARLATALGDAETAATAARAIVDDLESQLASLADSPDDES